MIATQSTRFVELNHASHDDAEEQIHTAVIATLLSQFKANATPSGQAIFPISGACLAEDNENVAEYQPILLAF